MKGEFLLSEILPTAIEIVTLLKAFSSRIEIVGSIRRKKPVVGDIEILLAPKPIPQLDLFGGKISTVNLSVKAIDDDLRQSAGAKFIEGGTRYRKYVLPRRIGLDVFLCHPPAQWGVNMVLRTGPAEFSKWVVTQRQKNGALPSFTTVHEGGVYHGRDLIKMPEEIQFLNFLGLGWIEPELRKPGLLPETG